MCRVELDVSERRCGPFLLRVVLMCLVSVMIAGGSCSAFRAPPYVRRNGMKYMAGDELPLHVFNPSAGVLPDPLLSAPFIYDLTAAGAAAAAAHPLYYGDGYIDNSGGPRWRNVDFEPSELIPDTMGSSGGGSSPHPWRMSKRQFTKIIGYLPAVYMNVLPYCMP